MFFNKKAKLFGDIGRTEEDAVTTEEEIDTNEEESSCNDDEWIWVEGYKGTDKNMQCKGYQYELGRTHNYDGDIITGRSGFHLCPSLSDVYAHYPVQYGNRFFKVKALVRKNDVRDYEHGWSTYYASDILTSKSIEFIRELSTDELFEEWETEGLSSEEVAQAREIGIRAVHDARKTRDLVELGFSVPFASHIIEENNYDVAYAVGSQENLSMDMKVLYILKH